MSAVYLGRQISLQRKVAIKVLKKLVMDDKSLAERFVDEAKTVASLDHPHIISIYEAKKLPSGLAYFTMPYLTHGDFGEIICTNSDHLIELLCQICDGLTHAHQHGIIHRDLKPENILFDQFGRIKIADFGIAISQHTKRKTKETQLLGSAHYMSPEQIQAREINHQSDIYSLGCIIYEKLTGDHVFQASNDFSILMSHINKPIPELPSALAEWQPILNQCLAKDPKQRYKDVAALKDALLAIKYSKQPAVIIDEPQTTSKPFKPVYLAAGMGVLSLMLLAAFFMTRTASDGDTDVQLAIEAQLLADQQAAAALQVKQQQEEALKLTVAVVENNENPEERVDLTSNLDNETINQMSLEVKLNEAEQLLKQYRLTKPRGDNAADMFQAILMEQPQNESAIQGLNQVGRYYFNLIERKLEDHEIQDAITHVQSLVDYLGEYNIDRELFEPQISAIMSTTNKLVTEAVYSRRKNSEAEGYLKMADILMPNYAFVADLKDSYNKIPQTGDFIADILGHDFVYFAATNDSGVKDFTVGTNEVTVEQFARFAGEQFTDEKCHHYDRQPFFKKTWLKPPFDQNNQHPVICITAAQAQAYAQWLGAQTGHTYRIPTAAEFEYVNQQLQAPINCQLANLAGAEVADESKATEQRYGCNDQQIFTAPVQSTQAVKKIHNLNGNVSEWVLECGKQTYCAMGTSWQSGRNATNNEVLSANPQETYSHVGFRLIRAL